MRNFGKIFHRVRAVDAQFWKDLLLRRAKKSRMFARRIIVEASVEASRGEFQTYIVSAAGEQDEEFQQGTGEDKGAFSK